jgi:hypothetical protein
VEGREAEQRLESGHRRTSTVEAKHEFVEVASYVAASNPVMGAREPGFEIREDAVDARKQDGCALGVALLGDRTVVVFASNWCTVGSEISPAIGSP